MLEDIEFWALFISILGGDFAIFWQSMQLKNEISDVREMNVELRKDMSLEFAKCGYHCSKMEEEKW